MTDATYVPFGQDNGAGDAKALFQKVATGEIITAFEQTVEFSDKHQVRSIASGKSAQFVVTGRKSGARYHTPGTQVLGSDFKQSERVITIDDVLLTDHFVNDIDEAMTHFDVRSEITKRMGEELAQAYDKNVAQVIIKAARASATVTGGDGGSALTNAAYLTDSDELANAFFDAAAVLDDKFVPNMRYGALKAAQYYMLARNTKVINKDWDGRGSYADGSVVKIADVMLVKTSNLPNGQNITTGPAKYQGDFSNTAGVIWEAGAAGTVKLRDLAFEQERMVSRQGELLVSKYLIGHDYLRPECAVELKTA